MLRDGDEYMQDIWLKFRVMSTQFIDRTRNRTRLTKNHEAQPHTLTHTHDSFFILCVCACLYVC